MPGVLVEIQRIIDDTRGRTSSQICYSGAYPVGHRRALARLQKRTIILLPYRSSE